MATGTIGKNNRRLVGAELWTAVEDLSDPVWETTLNKLEKDAREAIYSCTERVEKAVATPMGTTQLREVEKDAEAIKKESRKLGGLNRIRMIMAGWIKLK